MSLAASSPRQVFSILLIVIVAAAIFSTGCGSSGNMATPPPLTGSTSVTVVVSSTANDQLAEFDLGFQSITLTSQSGQTATLLIGADLGTGDGSRIHAHSMAPPSHWFTPAFRKVFTRVQPDPH